jgi:two-component system LytT family response regulator
MTWMMPHVSPPDVRKSSSAAFGSALPRVVDEPGDAPRSPASAAHQHLERLLIRRRERFVVLRLEDVDWIEGAGNYVRLHAGDSTHLHRQPLGDLADRLDPRRFVRIHRSTIVNVDRIDELRPLESGTYEVRLRGGVQLSMSRRYRRRVFEMAGRV